MKKIAGMLMLLSVATCANAAPVLSLGSLRFSDTYYDLNAAYISGGYTFTTSIPNISITPEVRFGVGTSTDIWSGPITLQLPPSIRPTFKLQNLYAVSLRGQWDFNNAYIYLAPGLLHTHVTSNPGHPVNSTDAGGGIGAGFNVTRHFSIEASRESFGRKIYSVGLRYRFSE